MSTKKDNKPQSDCEQLRKELEEMRKKAEENLNGWKRALADFSNYKKEQEAGQKEFIEFANAQLILEILPIIDSFDAAWRAMPRDLEKNSWAIGIGHIRAQFENLIKNKGIEKIGKVGEKFNPQIHEAVEKIGEIKKEAVVVEVMQYGYKVEDKVLRPAKVKVG